MTSRDDHSTNQYSYDLVTDMMKELCEDMIMAATQYLLLKNKIHYITVRLNRSLRSARVRMATVANLELQRDTTCGVLSMYRQYFMRKRYQLHKLQRARARIGSH